MRLDEDALICDLAETYHIFDMYSHPVELISTLAMGLRNDSRIKMKVAGMKVKPELLIMARIADNTALNLYAKTKDAQHGRNYPKSLVEALLTEKKPSETPKEFNSGAEFMKEWQRLTNG
jgi:hypothetical protein